MPELPEVESTVRRLRPYVLGRKIISLDVLWDRSIFCPDVAEFKSSVIEKQIVDLFRRGKFLVFQLEKNCATDGFLLIHLRMSGKIACFSEELGYIKHTRVAFLLNDKQLLRFDDVRKFGKCFFVNKLETITSDLGVEPLSRDFNPESLFSILQKKVSPIKTVLLNQHLIAGIGNIYADESLWKAGINPLQSAKTLSFKKVAQLCEAIKSILTEAIDASGTDFGDNVVVGDYSPKMYGRSGEVCLHCGSIIEHVIVGQRGTNFCPTCQVLI